MSAVHASHLHHGGAFDPAAWLAAFEAAGGWYILHDDHLTIGYSLAPQPLANRDEARRLYHIVRTRDDWWNALFEQVERRQLMEVPQ